MPRIRPAWLLILSTAVAGCLPSSCAREESRELFPADSLSRTLAGRIPLDTLDVVYDSATGDTRFKHPRTILFDSDGNILISDPEGNEIITLDPLGTELHRLALDGVVGQDVIPYLAGVSGDSTHLFLAGPNRVVTLQNGRVVSDFSLDSTDASMQLRYATTADAGVWLKTTDPDHGARVARYDVRGKRQTGLPLDGPYWAHAGPLRMIGDTVISVQGYAPIVRRIHPDGSVDSLRFLGFDSPMLARMRSYQLGSASSPPLLITSLAGTEFGYFVVNVRPGWLRIDVYGRRGQIEAILTEPDPSYNKAFYPTDIAVRRDGDRYLLAVAIARPVPSVRLYEWRHHR